MARNRREAVDSASLTQQPSTLVSTEWDDEDEIVQLAREIFVHRGATPNGFTPERVARDAFNQAEAFLNERQRRQNPTD